MQTYRILTGDVRVSLPLLDSGSVQCCVTSPPYWALRDYGCDGQIGLEKTPQEYVDALVSVFREVRRVLRDDGTLWLNLGDSYANAGAAPPRSDHSGNVSTGTYGTQGYAKASAAPFRDTPQGLKPKDLVGIPWRVAFALQADGWYLRSDIIWSKPNPMPESVTDRPTKAHEYVFLLSKSARYYFGQDDVREPSAKPWNSAKGFVSNGRNAEVEASTPLRRGTRGINTHHDDEDKTGRNIRSVWDIATEPCREAHFAVMPRALARKCILAGCPIGGTVLDPFGGAGTVALESVASQRNAVICELNPAYADIARRRLRAEVPMFATEAA